MQSPAVTTRRSPVDSCDKSDTVRLSRAARLSRSIRDEKFMHLRLENERVFCNPVDFGTLSNCVCVCYFLFVCHVLSQTPQLERLQQQPRAARASARSRGFSITRLSHGVERGAILQLRALRYVYFILLTLRQRARWAHFKNSRKQTAASLLCLRPISHGPCCCTARRARCVPTEWHTQHSQAYTQTLFLIKLSVCLLIRYRGDCKMCNADAVGRSALLLLRDSQTGANGSQRWRRAVDALYHLSVD